MELIMNQNESQIADETVLEINLLIESIKDLFAKYGLPHDDINFLYRQDLNAEELIKFNEPLLLYKSNSTYYDMIKDHTSEFAEMVFKNRFVCEIYPPIQNNKINITDFFVAIHKDIDCSAIKDDLEIHLDYGLIGGITHNEAIYLKNSRFLNLDGLFTWFNNFHALVKFGEGSVATVILEEQFKMQPVPVLPLSKEERLKHDLVRTTFLKSDAAQKFYDYIRVKPSLLAGDKETNLHFVDWWRKQESTRRYEGIIFDPSKDPFVTKDNFYNLWHGWKTEIIDYDISICERKCSNFLNHIKTIIADNDGDCYEYYLDWMAHLIQKPWELPEVALVLLGGQGEGKSSFVEQFSKTLSSLYYVLIYDMEQLFGKHNDDMKDKLLVFFDDIKNVTDNNMGKLRARITSKTIKIEPKFANRFSVRNNIRYIFAANDDDVFKFDIDERRFFVKKISDEKKEDYEYFDGIEKQMDNGGVEALFTLLSKRDISNFNPRKYPVTEEYINSILKTVEGFKRFWLQLIFNNDKTTWKKTWKRKDFFDLYIGYCTRNRISIAKNVETTVGMKLRDVLPKGCSFNARRNYYDFPEYDACRKVHSKIVDRMR